MSERVGFLAPAHARSVARIDLEARAGDFLPSLGEDFLTSLYSGMFAASESWGHGVFTEGGELLGFLVGAADTAQVFRRLSPLRNPKMALAAARALVRRPRVLPRMVESALYPAHETSGIPAELVVMGVRKDVRSQGYGGLLVGALESELRRRGVTRYRVTVKEKNQAALRFYHRHGLGEVSRFVMYGECWRVLARSLAVS